MPRGQNFFYQDPTASIGASLGKALFGDPEAARALAESRAKMDALAAQAEENRAHAGLYGTQADDQRMRTGYRGSFADLARDLATTSGIGAQAPAPTFAASDDPLAPLPTPGPSEAPAPVAFNPQGFKSGIVPLIAAMAGAQENPNIAEAIGAFGAMMGDDETARRALIAQGKTPDKDFALTADRADAIAQQGYDADYRKGVDVARTNHATDIPVANIQADASRYRANVGADASRDVARIRGEGNYVPMGESLITSVLPGAHINGGERDPTHNKEVGGAAGSYHLPGDGVEAYDIAPVPGQTFDQARAAMRAKYGSRLVEAIDETKHTNGTGPHWHFAVAQERVTKGKGGSGSTASAKAPKPVPAASMKMLGTELDSQLKGRRLGVEAGARSTILGFAVENFQRSGNPVTAVAEAIDLAKRNSDGRKPKPQQMAGKASPPPAKAAPAKPDANALRKKAMAAIGKGAPQNLVAQRFKRMTGQDL